MSRKTPFPRPLAIAGVVAGIALVVGAFWMPVVRVPGGGLSREGWWVAELGVATAIAAAAAMSRWRRAGAFLALLVLGVTAQLELTYPMWLQYVELRPGRLMQGTAPIGVATLALQAVIVFVAARGRLGRWFATARSALTARGAIALLAVLVITGGHATLFAREDSALRAVAGFATQAAAATLFVGINVVHVILVVQAIPADALSELRDRVARRLTLPGETRETTIADVVFPRVVAVMVFVAAAVLSWVALERVPHIPDSAGYLFHAKCLASGALDASAPPVPEAFDIYLLETGGDRWWCTMNPGWPAILALGVLAGAEWLVNPLIAGAMVLLIHRLVRVVADRGTAHAAVALTAVSPWYLFLGASFMTHTVTLALVIGAWALLARWHRTGGALWVGFAGLLLGYAVAVRSLDGLIAGVVTGAWVLFARPLRWRAAIVFAFGCLAGSAWLLAYNDAFTGDPLVFPLNDYYDRTWYPGANRLGFGADVGNPPQHWWQLDPFKGHGPIDVALNFNQNAYNTSFELFGWATGSLLLPLAHAILGRRTAIDRWLLIFTVAVCGAFSLYWFSGGPDFGARYWFLLFAPLLWWTVSGALSLAAWLRERPGGDDAGMRVAAAMVALSAVAVATFVPWRVVARYDGYRDSHGEFRDLVSTPALANALVLVETSSEAEYLAAFSLNEPDLRSGGAIFARDLDPETSRRLREAFPGRPVLRVRGRSLNGGQRVVVTHEE